LEFIAQFAGAIAGTYLLAAVLPSNIVVNTALVWPLYTSPYLPLKDITYVYHLRNRR